MLSDSCFGQNSQMQHAQVCCNANKHVCQIGIQFNALRELLMPCTGMATFEKVLCTFINESVMLRLLKIFPARGNQQTKVIYTQ